MSTNELRVILPEPHEYQARFIDHPAKRKVIRAGRRGGKTVGMSIYAVEQFLAGHRVLYAAPTADQLDMFWRHIKASLREPIDRQVLRKDETLHYIELAGTEQRIRAKTAWNADTLRGDYADVLILDEWQLMNEEAWDRVGAPMLLDNDGDAVFIYTPPSLQSRSVSKARDPQHAAKLFKRAALDTSGRWATFTFKSADNPHISKAALAEISKDMTSLAYRQEILAEDIDEAPGALWTRANVEAGRVLRAPDCDMIVVGVDPSATSTGDEAGIVTAGRHGGQFYVLADDTLQGSPEAWATAAVTAYHRFRADAIIAESNNGGEMVASVIRQVDARVPVRLVHASRGKQTRAQPVAILYEPGQQRAHHVGSFPALEDELCIWVPGDPSPNRLDALVWCGTYLMVDATGPVTSGANPFYS